MRSRPVRHILMVAYLYPPCNAVPAHRPAGLRRAFESAGVRTTVLTSKISGSYEDDRERRIIRAGDLRTRFRTQYQTLVGYRDGPLETRAEPRWWANYIVPDPTAVSWFPQALVQLLKLIGSDRPDVIVTTSGPESSHLLGLVARAFGIRWVADYRDGWLRDVRHPAPLRVIDRALERLIARRSTIVTAVNDAIAADIAHRQGVPTFTISNGFDRSVVASASEERATLDPRRFSLVYTGLLAIDVGEQPVVNRGRDAQEFLDALALLLATHPSFAGRVELVIAGPISESEREVLTRGELRKVVRVLGLLPRERALGLQQAADGLLLIPGGAGATTAKVFEYLAARKPIFAVTERNSVAAELLGRAGEHTIAQPGDVPVLAGALRDYVIRWEAEGAVYEPSSDFDLDAYEYETLGGKLLTLLTTSSEGSNAANGFDPVEYWERMHRENRGFAAVGFAGLGVGFNTWMYRVRRVALARALRRAGLRVEGASVLDVGAGTGFYVRAWLQLGAAHVTGIDLSEAAVAALRAAFPTEEFVRDDIADPSRSLSAQYDVVSAFDVLFHIVDDDRFARAIRNIGALTRPGGHLLLSDNFLHGPPVRGRHQVSRSRAEIDEALRAAGFETVARLPTFFLMNTPIDSQSRVLHFWWRKVCGICHRSDRAGAVLGGLLFPLELLLTGLTQEGPSTELVVCRRR